MKKGNPTLTAINRCLTAYSRMLYAFFHRFQSEKQQNRKKSSIETDEGSQIYFRKKRRLSKKKKKKNYHFVQIHFFSIPSLTIKNEHGSDLPFMTI